MLHSVGCAQPKAQVFVKQFDNASLQKAVHAFIDFESGDVYQCLPWNVKAWHCGSRCVHMAAVSAIVRAYYGGRLSSRERVVNGL